MSGRLPPSPRLPAGDPARPGHGGNGSHRANGSPLPADDAGSPAPMEIRLDRGRRIKGLVAYALFTAAVGGLLVWVFVQFTASVRIAVGLVAFLLAYMYGMAALASRGHEQREPDE